MTDQGTRSPDRPPCATSFLVALEPNGSQRDIDQAVEAASSASLQTDCINCLGRLGTQDTKIRCPIKFEGGVSSAQLIALQRLPVVEMGRLTRSLDGSIEPIPPLDIRLAKALDNTGFRQPDELTNITFDEDEREEPLPDDTCITAPSSQPRGEEVILQKRPPCAGTLASFFKKRAEAIERWSIKNIPLSKKFQQPIDHRYDESLYSKAVSESKEAAPEDCEKCLQENCPLKKEVPPKNAYDYMNIKVKLASGKKKKMSKVAIEITSGHQRGEQPLEILDTLGVRLEKNAAKHGGEYKKKVA